MGKKAPLLNDESFRGLPKEELKELRRFKKSLMLTLHNKALLKQVGELEWELDKAKTLIKDLETDAQIYEERINVLRNSLAESNIALDKFRNTEVWKFQEEIAVFQKQILENAVFVDVLVYCLRSNNSLIEKAVKKLKLDKEVKIKLLAFLPHKSKNSNGGISENNLS
jgi:hypothetical protein